MELTVRPQFGEIELKPDISLKLKKNSSSRTTELQHNLLEMGYDIKLINNLLEYLEVNSIEQGIDYLTQNDAGLWMHPYTNFNSEANSIESGQIKTKNCYICDDPEEKHFTASAKRIEIGVNDVLTGNEDKGREKGFFAQTLLKKISSKKYRDIEKEAYLSLRDKENLQKARAYSFEKKSNNSRKNTTESNQYNLSLQKSISNKVNKRNEVKFQLDNSFREDLQFSDDDDSFPDLELTKRVSRRSHDRNVDKPTEPHIIDTIQRRDSIENLRRRMTNLRRQIVIDTRVDFRRYMYPSSEVKNSSTSATCEVCMNYLGDEVGEVNAEKCSHKFCKSCLSGHITYKINVSDVGNISCPSGCEGAFSEDFIKGLITSTDFEKYKKFLKKYQISQIKGVILCPAIDCDSYTIKKKKTKNLKKLAIVKLKEKELNELSSDKTEALIGSRTEETKEQNSINVGQNDNLSDPENTEDTLDEIMEESKVEEESTTEERVEIRREFSTIGSKELIEDDALLCLNGHKICSKCHQLYHSGVKCNTQLDDDFNKWRIEKRQNVKMCPECNFYIEKNEGCNHMTCGNKNCKHQFCWLCLGKYGNGNHFYNPVISCYGLQFVNENSPIMLYPCVKYLRHFGVLFGFFLLGLLTWTVSAPFLIFYNMTDLPGFGKLWKTYRRNCFLSFLMRSMVIIFYIAQSFTYFIFGYAVGAAMLVGYPAYRFYKAYKS